jgi:L-fucose isomerase-like protein
MPEKKPLLGLCPIGKFVFSNEDAIRFKKSLQSKLSEWGVAYVDLEGVLEDGLVKDQSHVETAVEHFRQAGVDCLFMPHCNFGTEGAVGMIAKKLAVPTLLWGPRDEAPLADGTRLRDTMCGLFASSKVLYKLGVPFTYIENCRIDEEPLQTGVDTFLRAVNVANALRKGIRIGMIGQRIDFFWTTIVNESELLQRFNVEVLPFDMVDFIRDARQRAGTCAAVTR